MLRQLVKWLRLHNQPDMLQAGSMQLPLLALLPAGRQAVPVIALKLLSCEKSFSLGRRQAASGAHYSSHLHPAVKQALPTGTL